MLAVTAACTPCLTAPAMADWVLDWSDEFSGNQVDTNRWFLRDDGNVFNNELQYYSPDQATVSGGNLIITAENKFTNGRFYTSARLESHTTVRYGRIEVRAKIPTTKGIWPAIWLYPKAVPWPTGGEIDIMEHAGSKPFEVSSAYHYNDVANTSRFTTLGYNDGTAWPDDFHTYAVEWEPTQLRFFVNGVNYHTVNASDAFPISGTGMNVILNTAVGGIFDGNPDATTVFPQEFLVDYVRVYRDEAFDREKLTNGFFEEGTTGWNMQGNAFYHGHDIFTVPKFTALEGAQSEAMKFFGFETTYIEQTDIAVTPDQGFDFSAYTRVNNDDSIFGTTNRLDAEFRWRDAGDGLLSTDVFTLHDGTKPTEQWLQSAFALTAPAGAATLDVRFRFVQPNGQGGAIWLDGTSLIANAALLGDVNGDGAIDVADVDALIANFGDPAYDLTDDGTTDDADLDALLGDILNTTRGDANLDGSVDTADLAVLAGNFGNAVSSWADADFNGDGSVDTSDLAVLAGQFGASPAISAATAAVPEPASAACLGLAGLALGVRPRRTAS
ncbi:MAG: family 16 glycosylhydrolase [Planctomycetota bacterium]